VFNRRERERLSTRISRNRRHHVMSFLSDVHLGTVLMALAKYPEELAGKIDPTKLAAVVQHDAMDAAKVIDMVGKGDFNGLIAMSPALVADVREALGV
jgi:hypothetical protein